MKIEAKIVKDAISEDGVPLTCFSLQYGLMVHAEFARHREQSRSVKSKCNG